MATLGSRPRRGCQCVALHLQEGKEIVGVRVGALGTYWMLILGRRRARRARVVSAAGANLLGPGCRGRPRRAAYSGGGVEQSSDGQREGAHEKGAQNGGCSYCQGVGR